MDNKWEKALKILNKGELAVIPTDTIYGIVALALNEEAVKKLYRIRGRNPKKPCIILCHSMKDLSMLGIVISKNEKKILSQIWPNAISVIFNWPSDHFRYLHRGTKTIAFRIPKNKKLRDFLKISGPIVAPSANWEGETPAKSIKEAKRYFGKKVGVYINGRVKNRPSTLISVLNGKIRVLREGAWNVPKNLLGGV